MLHPQAASILKSLERGDALLRIAGWPEPILGHVMFVPPHRGSSSTPAPHLAVIPAKRLSEIPELNDALTRATGELGRTRKTAVGTPSKQLPHVHDVIADWVRWPGKPLSKIWLALGIRSPAVQLRVRQSLVDEKLANIVDEQIGSTKVALLDPTEAGYALVGRNVPNGIGRGKTVHRNCAYWARDWARQQGYEAFLEWLATGSNHPVDVAYGVGDRFHVIEVVDKCDQNLVDSIRSSLMLSTVVETVTVVAKQKKLASDLRAKLQATPELAAVIDRVRYNTYDFYLRAVHP
jgi:hypothetical protein